MVPLKMQWRHLLFENYPVDRDVIAPHVPDSLTVDEFDGSAWLSIIPFVNRAVRPAMVPESLGIRLPELNLRTYVSYDGTPGVYFFSLDADGIASVIGARLTHHLPYYYADIDIEWTDGRVEFASRRRHPGARPARYEAAYWPSGELFQATEDPLGAFLAERYRLYAEDQAGHLRYTAVDHETWPLYPAEADVGRNTLCAAEGFASPDSEPEFLYSPGVDVTAAPSKRVDE